MLKSTDEACVLAEDRRLQPRTQRDNIQQHSVSNAQMSSKSPQKRQENGNENNALRETCVKILSNFADDGATIEMLKKAIRGDGNHILVDENSPNGGQALKALLETDPSFEKVGKNRYRLAMAAPKNGKASQSPQKKGIKRDLQQLTGSQAKSVSPSKATRSKPPSGTSTPSAASQSPAKAKSAKASALHSAQRTGTPKATPKASPSKSKSAAANGQGSNEAGCSSPVLDPDAVLEAAIAQVTGRIVRLKTAVESARARVEELAANPPPAPPAVPKGVSAAVMSNDFMTLSPSAIDVGFIDKCTSLPQEILDAVPPELKEYTGEANDRKALMEFKRQRAKKLRAIVQHEQKRAAAAKKKAQDGSVREVSVARKALTKQEVALKMAQQQLTALQNGGLLEFRKVAPVSDVVRLEASAKKAAQKAAERAGVLAQRVLAKAARGQQRKAERAGVLEAKGATRDVLAEQRRLEAQAAAKQYPMDDQELLAELKNTEGAAVAAVPLPVEPLPADESEAELMTLYIADFLQTFQKPLDLPRLTLANLRAALSGDPEARGTGLLRKAMHQITAVIVKDLMDKSAPSRQDKRWNAALSPGTWPEVLRRYVLTRVADLEAPLAPLEATQAAFAMSVLGFDGLPLPQKLALLSVVCDEALDTDVLREELAERADRADQTAKDVRTVCQEERRRLRELQEEEREMKRRHREELAASSAPDDAKPAEGENKGNSAKGATAAADIPPARRRQIESAEKAMAARVKKAKASCEDTLARQENRLEVSTRRYNTRGAVIGADRRWLPVWHRAAGEKSVVVAADDGGALAILDTREAVEAYCAGLDTRGVREHGLNAALQAVLPTLPREAAAAGKAERQEVVAQEGVRVLPRRQARDDAAAQVERLANKGRDKPALAPVPPYEMELAALDSIDSGVRAAVEVLREHKEAMSRPAARTLERVGADVATACLAMRIAPGEVTRLIVLKVALRDLDLVLREVCSQQSRKQLESSSDEEEEGDGGGDGDSDVEMRDAEETEEEEEEEDEADLSRIEVTMERCAAALLDRHELPSAEDLAVLTAGTDHTAETYHARRRDRPWWDTWEQRIWQQEVDGAGTVAAVAYLLESLRLVCRRLLRTE
eukprot:jgi/Ulvmu1/2574/UM014_0025.1